MVEPAAPAAPAVVEHRVALRAPRVRPLVQATGHPHARRPARTPHQHQHRQQSPHQLSQQPYQHPAATQADPRRPRHPRAACAPAHGDHADLAARFAQRLVEVLTGLRPAGQLQRHTTLPGYQQLTELVRSGPMRPRGRLTSHRLGRVYDSAPAPGALEVCVRVEFGPRHHMVAFRLERHRRTEQWQCAAVEAH